MQIFNVPSETRNMVIRQVLSADYRAAGRPVPDRFKWFAEEATEQAFDKLFDHGQKYVLKYQQKNSVC